MNKRKFWTGCIGNILLLWIVGYLIYTSRYAEHCFALGIYDLIYNGKFQIIPLFQSFIPFFSLVTIALIVFSLVIKNITIFKRKIHLLTIAQATINLFLIGLFVAATIHFYPAFQAEKNIAHMRTFFQKERYVIHACGYIEKDGTRYSYTNSKEALEKCYADGNRIAEIDFMLSSDNVIICAHNGDDTWVKGIPSQDPLTLDEFLSSKIYEHFTPMSLDDLAEFLRQHKDFLVVTDVKDTNDIICTTIRDLYPDLQDQFIIQIYGAEEYQMVHDLGFQYMIFTLYHTSEKERDPQVLKKFSDKNMLVGFTFKKAWVEDTEYFSQMQDIGIPLMLHTVNTYKEIRSYFKLGVTALYTDNTQVTIEFD